MSAAAPAADARWWIAEIDIRPLAGASQTTVPDACAGALGWVAAWGTDEAHVVAEMRSILAGEGLELVGVDTLKPIGSIAEAAIHSRQVARNLGTGESLGTLVWGDLFPYRPEAGA